VVTEQLEFTVDELLADIDVAESLTIGGTVCHGGFDNDGAYVSPRTRHRIPAIEAWQANRAATFGIGLLDIPLETWPGCFPTSPRPGSSSTVRFPSRSWRR